ncbi:hypothetical protein NHG85_05435 [Limimaricola sp. ASW11-118]|uniref:Uncharacterized protein n=1 Tax=Limimaricola litoreus TaxID=2955316 RepID=A0A9X2JQT8_9RHOB|nr:hypothetical protein [Limimaricola litoreus]MCP1167971.1 hypothetical protein [Limimaricola litoreus]
MIVERVPLIALDLREIVGECRPGAAVHVLHDLRQMEELLQAIGRADLGFIGVAAEAREGLFAHPMLQERLGRVVITDRVAIPAEPPAHWFVEPRPVVPAAVRRHVLSIEAPVS